MSIAVKICGVTRSTDVEAAIEAGADAIGVVFDHGPRKLDFDAARELLEVTKGVHVERVAVLGALPAAARMRAAELGFDLAQVVLGADEGPSSAPLPLLPAFFDHEGLVAEVEAFRRAHPRGELRQGTLAGMVNVDGPGGGGTGRQADWSRARRLAESGPLMLSGGLTADNLGAALDRVPARAVDVCSGVEASPGIKSARRMQAFVDALRQWETEAPEVA